MKKGTINRQLKKKFKESAMKCITKAIVWLRFFLFKKKIRVKYLLFTKLNSIGYRLNNLMNRTKTGTSVINFIKDIREDGRSFKELTIIPMFSFGYLKFDEAVDILMKETHLLEDESTIKMCENGFDFFVEDLAGYMLCELKKIRIYEYIEKREGKIDGFYLFKNHPMKLKWNERERVFVSKRDFFKVLYQQKYLHLNSLSLATLYFFDE